jgi:hypothetical protein
LEQRKFGVKIKAILGAITIAALVGATSAAQASAPGLSVRAAAKVAPADEAGGSPQPAPANSTAANLATPAVASSNSFFPIAVGLIASGGAAAAAFKSKGRPASP